MKTTIEQKLFFNSLKFFILALARELMRLTTHCTLLTYVTQTWGAVSNTGAGSSVEFLVQEDS